MDVSNLHTGDASTHSRIPCEWYNCPADFPQQYELAAHLLADHVGKGKRTAYFCAWTSCSTRFSTRRGLIEHLTIHTGNRSYLCPADNCGKVYKRADFLQKHIRAHDSRESRAARKRAARHDSAAAATGAASADTASDIGTIGIAVADNVSESSEDAPLAVVARQANMSDNDEVPHSDSDDDESVFAMPDEVESLLLAKLQALRGEVEQRQQMLEDVRVKTRRVRLENDIIIDALERG